MMSLSSVTILLSGHAKVLYLFGFKEGSRIKSQEMQSEVMLEASATLAAQNLGYDSLRDLQMNSWIKHYL